MENTNLAIDVEWEVMPNPILKTELMIVRKDNQQIVATINLANYEEDEEAFEVARIIALIPTLYKNRI